jgi:hypothetical protein
MTLGCPPGDGLSNQPPLEYCDDFNGDGFCDITYLADGSTIIENQKAIGAFKSSNTECDPDRDDNCVTGVGDSKETATGERKYNPDGAQFQNEFLPSFIPVAASLQAGQGILKMSELYPKC